MNFPNLLKFVSALVQARLLKRRSPLGVSWKLTYRCNAACEYCHLRFLKQQELTTQQIFSILDQLHRAGVYVISLTGGEPLLRDDIGDIIEHAISLGIKVTMNSNGALVPQKAAILKKLSFLRVSLDGPKEINDNVRGPGSFDRALAAINTMKSQGVHVGMNTVISKINAKSIPDLIALAKELDVGVSFQPVFKFIYGTQTPNPICPTPEEFHEAIRYLLNEKRKGCRIISNSDVALNHLLDWPHLKKINCAAGLLSCRIEPDGQLFACGWNNVSRDHYGVDLKRFSFFEALEMAKVPPCAGCVCAACVEFNLLVSLNPFILSSILREGTAKYGYIFNKQKV